MSHLKRILSYFFVLPEHTFESEYSGAMDIRWEKGRLALNSPHANYSYNQLHTVMQKGIRMALRHGLLAGDILNLGMGAGSTVSILRDEFQVKNPIISVEHDPKIIEVAKEYFDIDRFPLHTIHCQDAMDLVTGCEQNFSFIIIDLFKDKEVAPQFLTQEFFQQITSLLLPGGTLLFNHIDASHHPAGEFLDKLEFEELKISTNRVLIYRNTDRS